LLVHTHSAHLANHSLTVMLALGLTLTQSTTLPSMQVKCDQIKFNEPVLRLGIPE